MDKAGKQASGGGAQALPLERVRGIGPARAALFGRLGVATVGDLLYHLPRRYEDLTEVTPIGSVVSGTRVTVRGRVIAAREARSRSRRLQVVKAVLDDGTGRINALWFFARRMPMAKRLLSAGEIVLHGPVSAEAQELVIKNGEWEAVDRQSVHLSRVVPIYPATQGLPARLIRSAMAAALEQFGRDINDPLSPAIASGHGLLPLPDALRRAHFPHTPEEVKAARRRLAFDELLLFQLALGLRRRWREGAGRGIRFTGPETLTKELRRQLPFALTAGQERVVAEILADMAASRPMERLLLGDVGSGKTVVAALALLRAVECGYQGALMAPTAILAEQHRRTLDRLCGDGPVRMALLTSAQDERERRRILAQLARGEVDLVVGTHALLEESVAFQRLGLLVIDEQHRFGVRQRAALAGKGSLPDVLVMSATPIPRTLALTLYGDLDLSVLSGGPPGRKPVKTRWLGEDERPRAYDFIRRQAEAGRQTYIVCPLVAEGEESPPGVKNTLQEAERLRTILPGLRIGVLHGQLSADEKDEVMQHFRDGKLDVLVATTVIELGVDVATAAVMVVENADRFGLAQLHQLRGRVGRGSIQGWCLLFGEPKTEKGRERMEAFARLGTGEELAEMDLKLRGPGEFFGTRQAGLPEFRLPLSELFGQPKTVEEARRAAKEILAGDPDLVLAENRGLAAGLAERFGAWLGEAGGQLFG